MLKSILSEEDVRVWSDCTWIRMGPAAGSCENDYEALASTRDGEHLPIWATISFRSSVLLCTASDWLGKFKIYYQSEFYKYRAFKVCRNYM